MCSAVSIAVTANAEPIKQMFRIAKMQTAVLFIFDCDAADTCSEEQKWGCLVDTKPGAAA
jgi:hypothetical protein